jgi:cytosine/adenosine deaminase-related metal-dependent hydrolase
VLTLDDEDRECARADILIRDGVIAAIGPAVEPLRGDPEPEVIDAEGLLAMPGLVNGHFHSPGNFMKGAVPNLPLELFMLYEVPPLMEQAVSERFAYVRTLLGAAEMLKLGVTAVHDDAFFLPFPTTREVGGVMQAYADVGMRASVTLDQPNLVEYEKHPYLESLLSREAAARMAAAPRLSDAELLGCYAEFVERWHGAAEGRVRCAVSCSAPQRVTVDYLQALGELSERHDLPYNMHILETRLQRVFGQERLGRSLVAYADGLGVLTERALVIHAIWIDADDIRRLAASGCTVAHNPGSNLKLGSGVMPFRRLREAGVPICIGTDEATADDGVNVWSALKLAGMIHNIAEEDYRRWPTAPELLRAATGAGARAMRPAQPAGELKVGAAGDVILLDLDAGAFVPLNDIRRQLVYCEPGASVRATIVAGRVVVRDGRLLTVDEDALRGEARAFSAEFAAFMASCREGVAALEPFYSEMYLRGIRTPVPMQRWAGPMAP